MKTQWPDIILINGTSSAGKTTLSKALQNEFEKPYFYTGFDELIMCTPKRYWENADTPKQAIKDDFIKQGVEMVETQAPGEPRSVDAVFGPILQSSINAMAPIVATLVKSGNSVVFDHVLHNQRMYEDCVECFSQYRVFKVGVYCDLAQLEKRERARGDRVIGRARGLFNIVHNFCDYDIEVNTTRDTVQQCVEQIKVKILNLS